MLDMDFDISYPLKRLYAEIERLEASDIEEIRKTAKRMRLYLNDIAEAVDYLDEDEDDENSEQD